MELNLYDRYKVSSFEEFKSNYKQIIQIKGFIGARGQECDEYKSHVCVISGSLASGKTTMLHLIKEACKDAEILTLSQDMNYASCFENFIGKRSIESIIFKKKRYVFIDDIHLFDKAFITKVVKSCQDNPSVKVIVTVQSKEDTKVSEYRSTKVGSLFVKLNRITFQDCFLAVSDLIEKLNLNDEYDMENVMQIITQKKCNLRQTLQSMSKDEDIEEKAQGVNVSDMNVYDLTRYFIKNKVCDKFLSLQVSNLVLFIMYENLPKLLPMKTKKIQRENLMTYKTILEALTLYNDDESQSDNFGRNIVMEYAVRKINACICDREVLQDTPIKYTNVFNKLSVQSGFHKKLSTSIKDDHFTKPYIKAMCMPDSEDFVSKRILSDFSE